MSDQALNQDLLLRKELIDEILSSPDGVVKTASAATSKATRTQIREEGFQRAILPFDKITNDDLDYSGDDEISGVWFELEPDSPPARTVPYNSTPNTFIYRAEKYIVLISMITTEEATKNINHLRTYKTDLRQIVNDNMLRDIHTQEDVAFIVTVDRTVGASVIEVDAAGYTAETQWVRFDGGITRDNLKRAQSFLTDRRLPIGVFLINQRTANEFLGWTRDEIGGDLAQDIFRKGLKAMETFEVFNTPYIATIKNDLVPNGRMYQFTTKEFLGNALMLEDITVTIKKEYDIIRMRAQEQVGFTFGNTRGLQRVDFTLPSSYTA
jgi:hypothetical protein